MNAFEQRVYYTVLPNVALGESEYRPTSVANNSNKYGRYYRDAGKVAPSGEWKEKIRLIS